MKFNSLVFSLFMVGNLFASEGSQIDSMSQLVAKQPCKKPIGCQLYQYCVDRYNKEHGTTVHMPEDEVENLALKEELRIFAIKISFFDKSGNLVAPEWNSKTCRFRLPLMQEGNECVDFEIAKSIIESHEKPNPVGPLGLLKSFDDLKNGRLYCVACNSTNIPNLPSLKLQPKLKNKSHSSFAKLN